MQNPPNSQGGSGPPLMAPVPLSAAQQQAAPAANMERTPPPPAEAKRVFGISLNKLYERDGLVVPMVVYQCIQAVDLFGLNMEGIYRQSGSLNSVNRLKTMFDAGEFHASASLSSPLFFFGFLRSDTSLDSSNPMLDFRNPENFFHDVNSVTGLLKQFFRDLPDPLLTAEHHQAFIEAGSKPPLPGPPFLPSNIPSHLPTSHCLTRPNRTRRPHRPPRLPPLHHQLPPGPQLRDAPRPDAAPPPHHGQLARQQDELAQPGRHLRPHAHGVRGAGDGDRGRGVAD